MPLPGRLYSVRRGAASKCHSGSKCHALRRRRRLRQDRETIPASTFTPSDQPDAPPRYELLEHRLLSGIRLGRIPDLLFAQAEKNSMFIKRFKLFTLLGFDIYIDLSWFIIAILIVWSLASSLFPANYPDLPPSSYWTMGVVGALGLFVSIVLHELGHAVMARQFDMPMKGITLFIFGGVAEMTSEPPSAKAEFAVAVAGPIVSVALAVACYFGSVVGVAAGLPIEIVGILWYLGLINGIVVAFNLIPAFPLDGGRVLRSILWAAQGSLRSATRISSSIGSAFGVFLIIFGVFSIFGGNPIGGIWLCLIGLFLRGAAQMSYQQVLVRRALEGEPIGRFMHTDVRSVDTRMSLEQMVDDYIYRHHHKLYPVTDQGHLIGCVGVSDIKQVPRDEWSNKTAGEIAQPCSERNTISPHTDAIDALTQMSRDGVSRLMVVEDGELKGMITLKDLMQLIALKLELEDDTSASRPRRLSQGQTLAPPAGPREKHAQSPPWSTGGLTDAESR